MKIIDAHIHCTDSPGFAQTALNAGHQNTIAHLASAFDQSNIVMAIAMGTGGAATAADCRPLTIDLGGKLSPHCYNQPSFIAHCLGIDPQTLNTTDQSRVLAEFAEYLRTPQCIGLKIYAGYRHYYVNDPIYYPYYELAEYYQVPVVIHTGDTANSKALLKYAHPLTIDDVAVQFRQVNFVMAHYGNPWIVDATEVCKKNPNVYIDLSGLAEGHFDPDQFCTTYSGYIAYLQTWLTYLSRYDKVLYGSDWPLVNLPSYLELISRIVPAEYHEQVFYENARQVFSKLQQLGC